MTGPPIEVFLMPAALHCASQPTVVTTLLGSCVTVCLWDRARRIGGMNHYVLPRLDRDGLDLRYGDSAIDRLVHEMLARGSAVATLEAKIFGGATVLAVGTPENNVGTKNVRMARERLSHHNIPITAARTGGESGLFIRYWTATAEVLVREMAPRGAGGLCPPSPPARE